MDGVYVFMRDLNLPSVDQWNSAIKAEGFDLVIDSFDLRTEDGYLPATLKGEESGFEWYVSRVADMEEDPRMSFVFKPWIGDRDLVANLLYASQADEVTATYIAASVLAKLTDGMLWDRDPLGPPGSDFVSAEKAVEAARSIIAELESED